MLGPPLMDMKLQAEAGLSTLPRMRATTVFVAPVQLSLELSVCYLQN
jgi:hypothetical protein